MNQNKNTKQGSDHQLDHLTRLDYLVGSALSALTLGLYAFTAAPGVTMEDSGDFLNGLLTLGIVHPPGYPLYTMLGHLFSYLPLGDPAFNVNVFSAFWGALCLGVMYFNFRILAVYPFHAVFACVSLGFTAVFWSKTAVAEVYSFNAFLLALLVFWILSYNRDKAKWQLYVTGFATGLALSNHYPLAILAGTGLVFLLDYKNLRPVDFLKSFMCLILGLTPYLYLFIQATNPDLQYNFGKSTNFDMVLDHIFIRNHPQDYVGRASDKFILSVWFFAEMMKNFFLSSVFLCGGFFFSFFHKRPFRYPLLLAMLGPSLGLIFIFTFHVEDLYKVYILDFTIPSFLFASFFLAFGSQILMVRYVKPRVAYMILAALLLISQFGFNFASASHHNDRLVEIWGTEILNSLEPDSTLILCGPAEFGVYYLQLGKGLRRDLTLVDRFSSWTKENLYGPELLSKQQDPIGYRKIRERQLINSSSRAIYTVCSDFLAADKIEFSLTPYVFRIDQRHKEASDFSRFPISERLLKSLVHDYPRNEYWLDRIRKGIFTRLISYYGGHNRPEAERIMDYFKKSKFYSDPPSLLSLASNLYFLNNHELAQTLYGRADRLSRESFDSQHLAIYCNLLVHKGTFDRALEVCTSQERVSAPCDTNTVNTRQAIAGIHKLKGERTKVIQYSRKILECQPEHRVARDYLDWAQQPMEKTLPTADLIGNNEPKK